MTYSGGGDKGTNWDGQPHFGPSVEGESFNEKGFHHVISHSISVQTV